MKFHLAVELLGWLILWLAGRTMADQQASKLDTGMVARIA